VQYKIVPEESSFIIGSNSKNSAGDFYALDISMALSEPQNQRKKRILDVAVTILLTVISPILILLIKQRAKFIKNLWEVLFGQKTWVGYTDSLNQNALPKIKQGVLSPVIKWNNQVEPGTANKLNFMYAKNYSIEKDLYIILISITKLGS
jgi:lipopolysaccharide/colanic/teichoic acid biosynthesis glycosyltransferase